MYIIAGLGNPGRQYAFTKHNCGFMALDLLGRRHDIGYPEDGHKGMFGKGRIAGERVVLVKPLTYMNLSGECLQSICAYYKIDVSSELIVIYDDIDLDPGVLRIRKSGSAGGHNGMKNIVRLLGTQDFIRVRIGVGAKPAGWDLADYVLSGFSDEEWPLMQTAFGNAADAVELILKEGPDAAMNKFN
ncbi:MAG: aminoacyl-tRNA hydrolase [Lachnospiraceae bacterium]|nr:aminoacyl-tRNA hydrolase [Lachnospiraceae bacterium]